jgi:lipid A 3-O-deacylase
MAMKYIVFSILLSIVAFGVESAEGDEKLGTFSLYFENDLFADTDQGYTNGIKLSWISPDLAGYAESGKLPDWSLPYGSLF